MYMLDTNTIIYAMRHPGTNCYNKVREHIGREDLCISVIVYAELEFGIKNSKYPERNREAVNKILADIRILDFDINAATHLGDILAYLRQHNLMQGGSDRDKMIAAHARSLGYTVVTNNTKDFIHIPDLKLEDWR